ncbi:MAG: sulfatase/phosphatase domain-containing protein, partial [Phycisphaerae bacterium]
NGGLLNNTHESDRLHDEMRQLDNTYPQLLNQAGYRMGYVGKWHVGIQRSPLEWGYHDYVPQARHGQYLREHGYPFPHDALADAAPLAPPNYRNPYHARYEGPVEATVHHFLVDQAIALLRRYAHEHRRTGRPFHLRLDFGPPHYPHILPEPYASMYDPAKIPPWPNFGDSFEAKPYANRKLRDEWAVTGVGWDFWAPLVARYWGDCTLLDHQIGRLLNELDALGLTEQTAVIFTTDHGDLTGSHGLFNKGPVPYEEIYRIPLLIRYPGLARPGSTCQAFVHLFDLMPTLLEMAGVAPPPDLDGRSLLPLLQGEQPADWPEDIFCTYHANELGLYSQRILRTRHWKFVYNVPDMNELYDLQADPHELHNLIDQPAYAGTQRALAERLLERMRQARDPLARWAPAGLGLIRQLGQQAADSG